MYGDDDLTEIFYGDEAIEFDLVGSNPVQIFRAHMGQVDEEFLQGYAVSTVRQIQYPTAAITLHEGNQITDGTNTWRVLREPRRVVDGAESQTYIVPA